jgi:AcrR family transcriptional regulator
MRLDDGRSGQKLRTRQALLAAARELMARGLPVTVPAAAAAAGISRATAYRYFDSPETLTMEAALDAVFASPAEVLRDATSARDAVHRVRRYLTASVLAHERAFRLFLAKALEASARDGAPQIRGGRRIPMFEAALEPVRGRMAPDAFAALVHALSGATGLEAHLALHDVCRLGPGEAERVSQLMVDAILDAMLPREA